MRRPAESTHGYIAVGLLLGMALATPARAVDGVIEINQASVKAAGGFPFVITQSGSYRLTSNLDVTVAGMQKGGTAPENTTAIQVTADDVTIDLNGFMIRGPTVCSGGASNTCTPTGTGIGIDAQSGPGPGMFHKGLAVINGTVRGMGSYGVHADGYASLIEKVRAESNGFFGITSVGGSVTNCTAYANGSIGILGGVVIGCAAFWNAKAGIGGSAVANSTAGFNGTDGIFGDAATGCSAHDNGGAGLNVLTATGCTARFNTGAQIPAAGIAGHNECGSPPVACP